MNKEKAKYHINEFESELDNLPRHSYTVKAKLVENKIKYKLQYSPASDWKDPKAVVLKAIDNGNGLTIGGITYSYDQASELRHLLNTIQLHDDKLFAPYSIVKKKVKIKKEK